MINSQSQQGLNEATYAAIEALYNDIRDLRTECMALSQIVPRLIEVHPDPDALFKHIEGTIAQVSHAMDPEMLAALREKLENYRP